MNKEWSELNKTLQTQIKKRETYEAGTNTLFDLRNQLMQVLTSFYDELNREEFDAIPFIMLMYGKEASNRKQEIDRQHHTIPNQRNQRPKDQKTSIVEMCITGYGIMDNSIHSTWKS